MRISPHVLACNLHLMRLHLEKPARKTKEDLDEDSKLRFGQHRNVTGSLKRTTSKLVVLPR